jgi:serine protease Do
MQHDLSAAMLAFALVLSAETSPADEPNGLAAAVAIQDAFVKAIESAEQSVVSIARAKLQPAAAPPPLVLPQRRQWMLPERQSGMERIDYVPNEFGAGIVIDENGLILTNYHLVRGGTPVDPKPDFKPDQTLYVRLPDRRGFEARIYAADPRSDLAVLKIAATDLKPIRFGNGTNIRKGQFVIALGNPYLIARDGSASATWGIIGNLVREPELDPELNADERRRKATIQNLGVLMHIDTRLDLGTSGGALLDLHGDLIGITTSLASIVGYEKSAGYAVPVNDATRRIIDALRQGKEVEYGFLGVRMDDADLSSTDEELAPIAAKFRQYGAARIKDTVPNLPADRAGIKANDLVLRVGEKPVLSMNDLQREIGLLAPGTTVRLRIWRPLSGRDLELPVEVVKWPVMNEEAMITSARLREPWRGIVCDYPTARYRSFGRDLGNSPERNSGVLILEVLPNSPAAALELRPDDLITHVRGKPVRTPKEFLELVQGETGPVPLQLLPGAAPQPISRTVEIRAR